MTPEIEPKIARTLIELKPELQRLAAMLRESPASASTAPQGGSRHRGLPEDLRTAMVAARKILFQRGMFNPLLSRFDSATVAPASNSELADELAKIAESIA